MPDISDYELVKTDAQQDSKPTARSRVWIAAVVGLAVAGIAAYLVYSRRLAPPPPVPAPKAEERPQPAGPLGGPAEPVAVPPLDESDPIVRDLVRRISSHPAVLAWLTTDGLIRNFTVVVANVAEGTTPARHLRVVRPTSPFGVIERDGELFIDSRSYERYDRLAAAAASIDPAAASSLYGTLKPRIEEAAAQLGLSGDSFDRVLERAIVVLLRTPRVDGSVRVEPRGIGYEFADPNLERLTAAQKQLLRTGPDNTHVIQSVLRQLAIALGIPAERLP